MMEALYGVSPDDGLAMWVADMDFRPPPSVNEALAAAVAHGVHGYFGDDRDYKAAITGWMARRHGWEVDPAAIATTHGIVAGARALPAGLHRARRRRDPVHARLPRLLPRAARQPPRDRRVPARRARRPLRHGPRRAGRRADRPRAHPGPLLAAQPRRPGLEPRRAPRASPTSAPPTTSCSSPTRSTTTWCCPATATSRCRWPRRRSLDRLVMLTATTKTFNIAGALTGNVIIPDEALRKRFAAAHLAAGTSPNRFGVLMATAAYAKRRRLGGRALPLPRRQRAALRRGRRRDPRPALDAARGHLPRLGRLRRHRHGAGRVHRPRRARRPHRPEPRPRLRQGRRELPALQPRHPARPRRRGGGAAAGGLRRPASGTPPDRAALSRTACCAWRAQFASASRAGPTRPGAAGSIPRGPPQKRELAYAAERFATIEINGTFYGLQRPESFAAWSEQVPPGFVFAVKGSRYITHFQRLRDIETPLANFLASGATSISTSTTTPRCVRPPTPPTSPRAWAPAPPDTVPCSPGGGGLYGRHGNGGGGMAGRGAGDRRGAAHRRGDGAHARRRGAAVAIHYHASRRCGRGAGRGAARRRRAGGGGRRRPARPRPPPRSWCRRRPRRSGGR